MSLEEISLEVHEFRQQFRCVLLSTAEKSHAELSYAPYIYEKESLYVFLSELAKHTQNLLNNPRAGLMFIENEQDSKNLFARRRLQLVAQARQIPREDAGHAPILHQMEQALGNTVGLLRTLGDFHLFQLNLVSGQYVRGFGAAYPIAFPGWRLALPGTGEAGGR